MSDRKISVKNVKRRRMASGVLLLVSAIPALVVLLAEPLSLALTFSEFFVIAAVGLVIGGLPLFGFLTLHYNRTVRRAYAKRAAKESQRRKNRA